MAVEIAVEPVAKEVVAAAVEAQVGTAVEVAWAASAEPGAMVVAVAGMVGVEGLVVAKAGVKVGARAVEREAGKVEGMVEEWAAVREAEEMAVATEVAAMVEATAVAAKVEGTVVVVQEVGMVAVATVVAMAAVAMAAERAEPGIVVAAAVEMVVVEMVVAMKVVEKEQPMIVTGGLCSLEAGC